MGYKGQKKTGGRKKGSNNKPIPGKYTTREMALKIAMLDNTGKSMAQIQIESARWIGELAEEKRARGELDLASKYASIASKIAHDVAPFIYATQASVRHAGDEDAPPIRIESLSDQQLEKLIERLRRS
jgi:hypothetical protein